VLATIKPTHTGLGSPIKIRFNPALPIAQPATCDGGILYRLDGEPDRLRFVVGPHPRLLPNELDLLMLSGGGLYIVLCSGAARPIEIVTSAKHTRDLWKTLGHPATRGYHTARLLTAATHPYQIRPLEGGRHLVDIPLS
jgi:hypothetical protein